MPLCVFISSSFTPTITSGISLSILKALELSIYTAPFLTISGANARLVEPPAEARTILTPSNASGTASITVYFLPLNSISFPALFFFV